MTNVQIENGKKRYQFAELERGDFFKSLSGAVYIKAKTPDCDCIYGVDIEQGVVRCFHPAEEVELINQVIIKFE